MNSSGRMTRNKIVLVFIFVSIEAVIACWFVYLCCAFRREGLLNRNTRLSIKRTLGATEMTAHAVNKTEKYEEMLNKAVDKALNRVFGSMATDIIYNHLESNYSIKKDEVARKLETFSQAMQDYLSSGAAVVEKEILENFYSGLGLFQRAELEGQRDHEFLERLRTLVPQ
jgi:hypothetical protein